MYKIKEKKKDKNIKIQNLITSTQNRVLNNTKIHQPQVEMKDKSKSIEKLKKKILREKEREITFCV